MSQVQYIRCRVQSNSQTVSYPVVRAHEYALLRSKHKVNATVDKIYEHKTATVDDIFAEYERLCRVYSPETVAAVFGQEEIGLSALRRAVDSGVDDFVLDYQPEVVLEDEKPLDEGEKIPFISLKGLADYHAWFAALGVDEDLPKTIKKSTEDLLEHARAALFGMTGKPVPDNVALGELLGALELKGVGPSANTPVAATG